MIKSKFVNLVSAVLLAAVLLAANVIAEPNEGVLFNVVADEFVDMM